MTIASPLCLMFSFADSPGSPELGDSLWPPSSVQLPVKSGLEETGDACQVASVKARKAASREVMALCLL